MKHEKIKNESILLISHWWGHATPGFQGISINLDNKLVTFKKTINFDGEVTEVYDELKTLSNEQIADLKRYLSEEDIMEKEYANHIVLDAGWTVYANINGSKKEIKNEKELYERINRYIYENIGVPAV